MTSQHFTAVEGKNEWDWEDGDWGESNNNNTNLIKTQQVPPVQQMHNPNFGSQPPQTSNSAIYSPFGYQQPAAQAAPHQFNNQNYYNSGFNDNVNNNPKTSPSAGFNHLPPQAASQQTNLPTQTNYVDRFQAVNHHENESRITQANYQQPPPVGNFQRAQHPFMPSPSTSPLQLPPPPQAESIADELYTSNQQQNLPAPPPVQNYENNFGRKVELAQRNSFDYQHPTWTQKPASVDPIHASQAPPQSWPTASNVNLHQPTLMQTAPVTQNASAFNSSALDSFNSHQNVNNFHEPQTNRTQEGSFSYGTSANFFENIETAHAVQSPLFETPSVVAASASPNPPQQLENVEQFVEHVTPPQVTSYTPQNAEHFYPENRERLDDISSPPSASFTDRHNYLVTGQLSQERPIAPQHHQQEDNRVLSESLPPPGLSRMVVGQPESNQQQVTVTDVPPPGLNRMVTGTETTPSNYMNYQRQADGEVSQAPSMAMPRPQSNSPFTGNLHHHQDIVQPSFNTSDRNLYLVAGESDVNSQRVIPGVESNFSSPGNLMSPMQNLHIQDHDEFVNVSVPVQERNVNVDGMETVPESQQLSIDAQPTREEVIDGANDNTEFLIIPTAEHALVPPALELESDVNVREEAIEGANDDAGKPIDDGKLKKLKPEIGMSSEDSELRELEHNKLKPKSHRSKKYDTNESENEYSDNDKKDRSYRRVPREKMSREEYEKNRRREKERRSGDRPRKGDDTDGSKYGDSKRRTDDDEDDYRKTREKFKKSVRRQQEGEEVDDKDRKKREKYRESGSRRKDYGYEEDRRERRRRERYQDDEAAFSGRRSQNASDREYVADRYSRRSRDHGEKERSKYDAAYYQQQPSYGGYDQSNYNYGQYYQHQQYYETLRRTNPQAYYEWYTKYYAMMQQAQVRQPQLASTIDDIGGSLRSGYSSSNEKDRASASRFLTGGDISNPLRSLNTSFVDNTDYHSLQGFNSKDVSQNYASMGYDPNYYDGSFSREKLSSTVTDVQRLTPKKFQSVHNYVRLTNGIMTSFDSSNIDGGYIVKIENVPMVDKTKRLYQSYPGPLVRGVSHKKTVIEFCEEKMKQDHTVVPSHRASFSLLWGYLILMLRQNGNYTEADISELLMKNSDDYKLNLDSSASQDEKKQVEDDSTDVSESEENVSSEKNSNSVSQSQEEVTSSLTNKVIIHKFRDYLLYGNINDALDYATDNNLWGHALFLASKVDRRQHANVMLKFANKLPYNDPLQTLYQIMSGRMPSCVTNLDDKWGDWRPHLAMIISNCTDKPDLVKRSIIALGDLLATRGDVYGSQFCYLLVDPQFKEYGDSSTECKLSLLGVSPQNVFKDFATDDAIIMSEVYEYARSLSEEHFFVPSLQKYKFLFAARVLDYGLQLKCLLYMEQIAKCVVAQSDSFDFNFISRVHSLADRLKFYDPVMEKSYEDNFNNNGQETTEDQKWLQELSSLLGGGHSSDVVQPFKPPIQEVTPQHSSNDAYNPLSYQSSGNYDQISQHQTPTHNASYGIDPLSYPQQPVSDQVQQESLNQYQQQEQNYSYEYNSVPTETQNTYQQLPEPTPYDSTTQNFQQQPVQPSYTDYNNSWDQNAYQAQQPTITMGNMASSKFEDNSNSQRNLGDDKTKTPVKRQEPEKAKKAQEGGGSGNGSGWFGGIFNKLSMKPKNQMILPDDKNPTILWDEKTKKWVNKDGDGAEVESFKPPPKMESMGMPMPQMPPGNSQMPQVAPQMPPGNPQMPQMIPQSQQQAPQQQIPQMQQINQFSQQPSMHVENSSMPIMQQNQIQPGITNQADDLTQQPPVAAAPNMFKMQNRRNLKKSYVDILGNSGQTISQPKELAPQMDMQFFNPQQQPQGMQFYNPNDFQ